MRIVMKLNQNPGEAVLVRKWQKKALMKDSPSWSMQQLFVELPGDPPFSSFPSKNRLRYGIQNEKKHLNNFTLLASYIAVILD